MSREVADKIYAVAHFTGEARRDAQSMRGPFRNCHEGLDAIQKETTKWQHLAQQKDQQCQLLDRTVEQLAKQQLHMEREAIKLHTGLSPESSVRSMETGNISTSSDDETSFQDAVCADSTCTCTTSDASVHSHHTIDCKRIRHRSYSGSENKTSGDVSMGVAKEEVEETSAQGVADDLNNVKSLVGGVIVDDAKNVTTLPVIDFSDIFDLELGKNESGHVSSSVSESLSRETKSSHGSVVSTRTPSSSEVTNVEAFEGISKDFTSATKQQDKHSLLGVLSGDSRIHSSAPDVTMFGDESQELPHKNHRSSADLTMCHVGDTSSIQQNKLSKSVDQDIDKLPVENGVQVSEIQEVGNEDSSDEEQEMGSEASTSSALSTANKNRRARVPDRPNSSLSLWSFIKNCLGQDLSKIPLPVNFNEPLSMLQRIVEDFEYSEILDHAATKDQWEQMAYVAAFTVSSYATTSNRPTKPFNPLLGETYELDYSQEKGWRVVTEQVSHHPPILGLHCESKNWTCWQDLAVTSKFRGNYLNIIPQGISHLTFSKTGNHYTWLKVITTVHNIVVGRLWVDQSGEMTITNHKTGDVCQMEFIPYSYFTTRDIQRKVQGSVIDARGFTRWLIKGKWDEYMEIAKLPEPEKADKNGKLKTKIPQSAWKVVWKRKMPKPDSVNYYNFTRFACVLNEPEEGVAPTDSRLRPDQRLMEDGDWDLANEEKLRLEEKQRTARRQREASAAVIKGIAEGKPIGTYEPTWFKLTTDEVTNKMIFTYKGDYWECKQRKDWSRCPNIF